MTAETASPTSSEYVAVVGSRKGADLAHVEQFVKALYEKHPGTILVSGGADGVDWLAEQTWLGLGGRVLSLRAYRIRDGEFGVECWKLGGEKPMVYPLRDELTFEDPRSAAYYRSILISEKADRVVCFSHDRYSNDLAYDWGLEAQPKPRYRYQAAA